MTDRRKPIDEEWASFAKQVLLKNVGTVQREEMRRAFFGGAVSLFSLIMNSLEGGDEATEADFKLMDDVKENFDDYARGMARKAAN